ncbi:hypothetical protein L2E82_07861 [Cichorium intybus]|uniref:Uncharacterized protein n=1 Tax=Cichorium intybus TaxID=13427 RepID=A0ACB9G4Y6_CICIN|nr:hypothetical protein L2E82_07861 [Cichorium intybus]
MAMVTILFAAVGFMSLASSGTLLTGMLFFYMILRILAGYVVVHLWRTISSDDNKGWASVCWKVAFFFLGIAFLTLFILNFLLWGSDSTGAIPFSLFVILIVGTEVVDRQSNVEKFMDNVAGIGVPCVQPYAEEESFELKWPGSFYLNPQTTSQQSDPNSLNLNPSEN